MSEEEITEEEIVNELVDRFDECGNLLMLCEVENRQCEDCGRSAKRDCLIFIRSVLASLCKLEVARNGGLKREIEERMYI